jgi:hypothetical protein
VFGVFSIALSTEILSVDKLDASVDHQAQTREAITLIREGAYNRGMEALRALGDQGNSGAYYHLAEIYRLGVHGEKAPDVAAMYYRLSYEQGYLDAGKMLANILFFNDMRTDNDEREAIGIWQQQALLGDAESQYYLGTIYWNGDAGLDFDPIRGYGLIWLASEAGHQDAIASEVIIASDLSFESRNRARLYADNLIEERFDEAPLELEMVLNDIATAAGGASDKFLAQGIWKIDVGFAQSEEKTSVFQTQLHQDVGGYLTDLDSDLHKTENGLYVISYSPIATLDEAVTRCVFLKKKGYDCNTAIIEKTPPGN